MPSLQEALLAKRKKSSNVWSMTQIVNACLTIADPLKNTCTVEVTEITQTFRD